MTQPEEPSIVCSCKQTRFHIDSPNYRELDIEKLTIVVAPTPTAPPPKNSRARAKARAEGLELLVDARLKLNAGQRYALLGRNGSGKSTLLRAIAEKLIPGIPDETRIGILQQTMAAGGGKEEESERGGDKSVIETVVDGVTARYEIEREAKALSGGINSENALDAVRALRTVQHSRALKNLASKDKQARLRSGARGLKARQALIAAENKASESEERLKQQDCEISAADIEQDVQDAAFLLSDLQLQIEPSRLSNVEASARKILAGLGFTEARMMQNVAELSGGWKMRTALATVLLQETDILILDEPTNYLDLVGIIWLQQHLESLASHDPDAAPTLIVVSHDRAFISMCTDLIILKDKALTLFHGSLPAYEASTHERRLWLLRMKEAQDRQRAHMQQTIAANIRTGKVTGDENRLRQAKSRQKRLEDRTGMSVNARGGRFKVNRDRPGFHNGARGEIEVPPGEGPVVLALPEPADDLRFPGALVAAEGVGFRYTKDGADVLEKVSLSVHMGDRVGILGLNGSGKSTLIKVLVGEEAPTTGTCTFHPRLKIGYYSQHAVEELQTLGRQDPALTALGLLTREIEQSPLSAAFDESSIRGVLSCLGLTGRSAAAVPLARLSGGQLVRCALGRILWRRPHGLVLDEVTTHLDYESVAALRECLRGWRGAVVIVSHDRWFLRGVVEGDAENAQEEEENAGAAGERREDEENEGGGNAARRRLVFGLQAKTLGQLPRGVAQFEELMERKVRKLRQRQQV